MSKKCPEIQINSVQDTYKVISEADEVFYFEATSADEAELLYNEAYLFPKEPHTHIHKIIKLKEA
jgi:hypothetical protein